MPFAFVLITGCNNTYYTLAGPDGKTYLTFEEVESILPGEPIVNIYMNTN